MASITRLLNIFNFGEVSPLLNGMANNPIYQNGAETLTNWLPMKTGGLRPRPGTRHIVDVSAGRLVLFAHTDGSPYVLFLTNNSAAVYDPSTHAAFSGSGLPLTTPWAAADIGTVQFAGLGGELWGVHRNDAPRKITLTGTTWAIATPSFSGDWTWGSSDNYPGVIAFFAGRLWLGSTNDDPYALLGSLIPTKTSGATNYLDFTIGSATAADAIFILENNMLARRLAWAAVAERMIIGTDKAIWMSDGSIPTPATYDLNVTSHDGAAEIQPQMLGNMILYVDSTKTKLKALYYSTDKDGFIDMEVSGHADHLLSRGIEEIQVMTNPEPVVWLRMTDGTVISATIQFTANGIVAGYAPHEMGGDGLVESICVVPKDSSDEVWLLVNRDSVYSIEYLYFKNLISTDAEDFFFVDNGTTVINSPASKTVECGAYLNTWEVDAFGDGGVLPRKTVAAGEVIYDVELEKVQIGIPYESLYRSVKPEIQLQTGTTQAKKKKIIKITLRMYKSLGGSVGVDPDDLEEMVFMISGDYVYGDPITPFTGDYEVPIAAYIDTDGQFYIKRDTPVPLIVLAAIVEIAPVEV